MNDGYVMPQSTMLRGYQPADYSLLAGLPVQTYAGNSEGLLAKQIPGTVRFTTDSELIGTGTRFLRDLSVGCAVRCGNFTCIVEGITSDTAADVYVVDETPTPFQNNVNIVGASVEVDFPLFRFTNGGRVVRSTVDASGQIMHHSSIFIVGGSSVEAHQLKNSSLILDRAEPTTITLPTAEEIFDSIHEFAKGTRWSVPVYNVGTDTVTISAGDGNTTIFNNNVIEAGGAVSLQILIADDFPKTVYVSIIGAPAPQQQNP